MASASRTTAGALVVVVAITALLLAVGTGRSQAGEPRPDELGDPDTGREIWQQDCAICHGPRGGGSFQGPDITEKGTAAVDFMVRTGRMPVGFRDDVPHQAERESVTYTEGEIRSLVAHTETFVEGPEAPDEVPLAGADLARGGSLFRRSCAPCHQLAGQGGALAYGNEAPTLVHSSPIETFEAVRTGPGSMPGFPEAIMAEDDLRDVAAYVDYLHDPEDRGGNPLGHLGPVPEGLVAWAVGLGACLLLCRWLGERQELETD